MSVGRSVGGLLLGVGVVGGLLLLVGLLGVVMRAIWVGPDKKATLVDAKDVTIVDESVENLCERTRR